MGEFPFLAREGQGGCNTNSGRAAPPLARSGVRIDARAVREPRYGAGADEAAASQAAVQGAGRATISATDRSALQAAGSTAIRDPAFSRRGKYDPFARGARRDSRALLRKGPRFRRYSARARSAAGCLHPPRLQRGARERSRTGHPRGSGAFARGRGADPAGAGTGQPLFRREERQGRPAFAERRQLPEYAGDRPGRAARQ